MIETNDSTLSCSKCKAPLPQDVFNTDELAACPSCGVATYAAVFPALFRTIEKGSAGEDLMLDTEASCYYHDNKKATVACEACGRFLCALCDVTLHDRHLCPACIQSSTRQNKIKNLRRSLPMYDSIALSASILPLLAWPLTCISAPATIYLVLRHWKAPTSIVGRTKIRFIFALLLASIQVVAWIAALIVIFGRS